MDELRKAVGRLFVVGFYGTTISDEIIDIIHRYYVGAIILFSRNIDTPEKLKKLTNDLQEEAKKAGYQTPLFITLDQENGIVKRIETITHLPGAMALGATHSPNEAEKSYGISANELKALGINWNLAPVADVNNNPKNPVIGVRSFGQDPKEVAKFVGSAVSGIESQGVMATLKHFPGHGDTATDSHLDLPVVDKSIDELRKVEWPPFEAGIEKGAGAVLLGHLRIPQITEKNLPASLSKNVVSILRQELHFKGIIVTDDLEMKAIADNYGIVQACELAVENGIDMVMISHSHASQKLALEGLYEKAQQDEKFKKRVLEANGAIEKQLQRFTKEDKDNLTTVNSPSHIDFSKTIYEKSLLAIPNVNSHPIKKGGKILLVNGAKGQLTGVEDGEDTTSPLTSILRKDGFHVDEVKSDEFLLQENSSLEKKLKSSYYDALVIVTQNLKEEDDSVFIDNIKKADNLSVPLFMVAIRNPYDYQYKPYHALFLATFEPTYEALVPIGKYLLGTFKAAGKSPVELE